MHYPLLLAEDPYAWIGWMIWGTVAIAITCFLIAWRILAKPPTPDSDKQRLPLVWQIVLALMISAVFTLGICLGLLA